MLQNHRFHLCQRRSCQLFPCCKIVIHLPKYPWISFHSTPDHHRITSGLPKKFLRLFRRIHIPISNHRNGNCFFNPGNGLPVCYPGIILLPCPSMNCNSCCPGILHALCNLHNIHRLILKTDTNFHCQWLLNGRRNAFHNLHDQIRIFQKSRTLTVIYHLRHRTSHIDIQNVKRLFLDFLRYLRHQLRLASKELHGNRMLHRVDFHQSPGIFVLIGNSLGTDHLHAEKPSALLFAKPAKSQVGNARHWCQDEPVRDLHSSDFPLHLLWKLISQLRI